MWKIKKVVSKGDYLYALVPEHPNATKNGYVLMHRVVVENQLGRVLNRNEVVHHRDGNKKNNDQTNLVVMDRCEHHRHHKLVEGRVLLKMRCPVCEKEFEIYKNQSFLIKKNRLNCNCCSSSCRGKLSRIVQRSGLTHKLKNAISGNILMEYRRYITKDNTEETDLQRTP